MGGSEWNQWTLDQVLPRLCPLPQGTLLMGALRDNTSPMDNRHFVLKLGLSHDTPCPAHLVPKRICSRRSLCQRGVHAYCTFY